jgi:Protein of unknown function (DUF2892)
MQWTADGQKEESVAMNLGGIDRAARIIIGVALLAWTVFGTVSARWFGLIGAVPLVTALAGWRPAHARFGLSSCRRNRVQRVSLAGRLAV